MMLMLVILMLITMAMTTNGADDNYNKNDSNDFDNEKKL